MADQLITLDQLKVAAGESTAPSPNDSKYTMAINSASELIRSYTGLRFEVGTNAVAGDRRFEYDGSGFLDIDEAQTITGVFTTAGYQGATSSPLDNYHWGAYPLNLPVKLWLRLPEDASSNPLSPEMGFTWNLDTLGYRQQVSPTLITVTAIWGWPAIPADVQQAAIWTALSIADAPKPYSQESIEGYSRTRGADVTEEAIPARAQVALLPYIIPRV